jgi:hypothetical protein
MKRLFFAGVALLVLFEIASVWLIMPLPGSQRVRSIDVAFALHRYRHVIRGVALLAIFAGIRDAFAPGLLKRVGATAALVVAALVTYATNYKMSADRIFIAPKSIAMKPAAENRVERNRLVVGVEVAGQARAYPVQFIGYHHQVRDTVAGQPVMVSFCTVCRTGRVFSPVVDGKTEDFRLVGMDHFNAMFEDATTGSWWRQANGEAIAGPKKGTALKEIPSVQVTLAQWLALHPQSLIMQADSALAAKYSKTFDYESGASRSSLTGTDTASWHDKSWVVGVTLNGASRAYDWNKLRHERAINDTLGGEPIVLAIASDAASFAAYRRPSADVMFTMRGDSLATGTGAFDLAGRGATSTLAQVQASQEFWHSWRTFQPGTSRY